MNAIDKFKSKIKQANIQGKITQIMQKSDNPYLSENAQIAPLPSGEEEE